MAPDSVDIEMAVLAAISNDRYLLEKAFDEGLDAQLFHAPTARLLIETLAHIRGQSIKAIDSLLVKTTIAERGQMSPQVGQYLETVSQVQPPRPDQFLAYLDLEAVKKPLKIIDNGKAPSNLCA